MDIKLKCFYGRQRSHISCYDDATLLKIKLTEAETLNNLLIGKNIISQGYEFVKLSPNLSKLSKKLSNEVLQAYLKMSCTSLMNICKGLFL